MIFEVGWAMPTKTNYGGHCPPYLRFLNIIYDSYRLHIGKNSDNFNLSIELIFDLYLGWILFTREGFWWAMPTLLKIFQISFRGIHKKDDSILWDIFLFANR